MNKIVAKYTQYEYNSNISKLKVSNLGGKKGMLSSNNNREMTANDVNRIANVKRGDLIFVDLGDGVGSEQKGIRPAIIISNDVGNSRSSVIIIAPLTSQFKRQLPTHVMLTKEESKLPKDSLIMLEQIKLVDKQRIKSITGCVTEEVMNKVNKAITISLGINTNQELSNYAIAKKKEEETEEIQILVGYINSLDKLILSDGFMDVKNVLETIRLKNNMLTNLSMLCDKYRREKETFYNEFKSNMLIKRKYPNLFNNQKSVYNVV